MKRSTEINPVNLEGIIRIMNKDDRSEFKSEIQCISNWLTNNPPHLYKNGSMSIIELNAILKLEKHFPYDILFKTIRKKYNIHNEDIIVAYRLDHFKTVYPNYFPKTEIKQIINYLMDPGSPSFNIKFLEILSDIESKIMTQLGEIEIGNRKEFVSQMSQVLLELDRIESYLLDTILNQVE